MKNNILTKWPSITVLEYLTFSLMLCNLPGKEIIVPSGSIQTIQQGVDAAEPGDSVIVRPGIYRDEDAIQWGCYVRIAPEKSGLKLRTMGPPGSVELIGPGWGIGIWVDANNAIVEGFKISGFRDGISAGGSQTHGTRITGNIISDCYAACIALTCAHDYEIDHNMLDGTQPEPNNTESHGIFLNGYPQGGLNTQHQIHHNTVSGAQNIGIFIWQSGGCEVAHNLCTKNGLMGIYIASSPSCTVTHNQTLNNGYGTDGMGIVILGSHNCLVVNNKANVNASYGLWVDDSESLYEHNTAQGNGQYDLFAPGWGSDPENPTPNIYVNNRGDTAIPNLATWDVKVSR